MIKEDINYYRKLANINYKFKIFEKLFFDRRIYLFNAFSRTYDLNVFKRNLWIPWQKRFFRRFPAQCLGVVEKTSTGLWHMHIWVAFDAEYKDSYILKDIASAGRKLWRDNHLAVTKLNLIKKNQFTVELLKSPENCRNYLSKSTRFKPDRTYYLAKPYGQLGSFCISHGLKGKRYWVRTDLPSYRFCPKILKTSLSVPVRKRISTS